MNDVSDKIVQNLDQNNIAEAEKELLKPLNSQDSNENGFVETPSADLISNETNKELCVCEDFEPSFNPNQSPGGIPPGFTIDESELPSTTIVLNTKWGSKVFVVGTSHFSVQSQEDVAKVIKAVQPNSIVLELCPSRSYMLTWTEEELQMAKKMDYKMIKEVINSYGVFQGAAQLLLLSMSYKITAEMGMPPGGEFWRAFRESHNIPGCVVFLGDRPIGITLRRAFASMSWWQLIKFAYSVIFSTLEINKDEIEKCKDRDYLGNMLEMMAGEFPALKEVFVNERDLYLTYNLLNVAMVAPEDSYPKIVVGVVGMGHLAGIQQIWEKEKVDENDIRRVLEIPPQTKTSKLLRFTFKASFYCLVFYGLHKLVSKTKLYSPLVSYIDKIGRK